MKRYLVAGLLVWVPLGITIWVLHWLVSTLDQTLVLLPENLQPQVLFGYRIPGLGVVMSFLILFVTGVVAANFFGARLIREWERLLGRIPFVKSIYSSVKQVSDTLLSESGNAFRKTLLVEWPRPGCWTIAFLTGTPAESVARHLTGEHVSIYVPTTPNPTGGYFVIVPKASVRELDISVDEALKYIISMGVVVPRATLLLRPEPQHRPPTPASPATPAPQTADIASQPRN